MNVALIATQLLDAILGYTYLLFSCFLFQIHVFAIHRSTGRGGFCKTARKMVNRISQQDMFVIAKKIWGKGLKRIEGTTQH